MIWGWILTIVGPLLFKVRAFLPGAGLISGLKVGLYVATLAAATVGGIWLSSWWTGEKLTVAEAQQRCSTTIAAVTIAAQLKAVNARDRLLRDREAAVAQDEAALADELLAMKEARDASTTRDGGGRVSIRDDDEWLRRYRARALGGAGRR
jgi:hypothetical protein